MNDEFDYIMDNIDRVMGKVEAAALRSGRKLSDITVIAVSKTVEPVRIAKALEYGILNLGENRVQELCDKYSEVEHSGEKLAAGPVKRLSKSNFRYNCAKPCANVAKGAHKIGSNFLSLPKWHLIGHLQTNKVKYIIDKVGMIHSLDRVELAEEIQKRAEKAGKIMEVLVQVNIAEEDSKFGIKKELVLDFIKKVSKLSNLKVRGLMTIAPLAENSEDVRWVFKELNKLHIDIMKENIDNIDMDYLSMGMSNDFEAAIEEGANMIRIGTAIFGKR